MFGIRNPSDERHVRVYTADTVTLKRLQWDARGCLWELMRKADRAGIIRCGEYGLQGLSDIIGFPQIWESRIQPGVTELLKADVLRTFGSGDDFGVVFPKFIAMQECATSDRQRKANERARRRDWAVAAAHGLLPEAVSRNVTGSHAPSREDTAGAQPSAGVEAFASAPPPPSAPPPTTSEEARTTSAEVSQNVTGSHEPSQPVTPCCAVPCRAVTTTTYAGDADASPAGGEAQPDLPGVSVPRAPKASKGAGKKSPPGGRQGAASKPKRAPRGVPGYRLLRDGVAATYKRVRKATFPGWKKHPKECGGAVKALLAMREEDIPVEQWVPLVLGWWEMALTHPWALKYRRERLSAFAANLGEYRPGGGAADTYRTPPPGGAPPPAAGAEVGMGPAPAACAVAGCDGVARGLTWAQSVCALHSEVVQEAVESLPVPKRNRAAATLVATLREGAGQLRAGAAP